LTGEGAERQLYLIALGSNIRHARFGTPRQVLAAALRRVAGAGTRVMAASPIIDSAPIGPSRRQYANGAALIESDLPPPAMLAALKRIEREYGRRRGGARWAARVLDLDILLWNGGAWADGELVIPHPAFRQRRFVLHPAATIAPCWRDPITGLTIAQLQARLTRPLPVPNPRPR